MSKSKLLGIIIVCVMCAWLFDLFIGRLLAAKLSTWPPLERWHFLGPQAPIVINNREVIQSADTINQSNAAQVVKSKLALIVQVSNRQFEVVASAVNLTSDGLFVTGLANFSRPNLIVLLNDGRSAPVLSATSDASAGLTFIKAPLDSVPVASLGDSGALQTGDEVVLIKDSLQSFADQLQTSTVAQTQTDSAGQVYSSDHFTRRFALQQVGTLAPGQAIANLNGDVVGLWNGSAIVSSSVINAELNSYLQNSNQLLRPAFGFSYEIITKAESQLADLPEGVRVSQIDNGSPAGKAGLEIGDVITTVNDNHVNQDNPLEPLLENFKPGDKLQLSIIRDRQTLTFELVAGQSK